jgi:hypothetical protein
MVKTKIMPIAYTIFVKGNLIVENADRANWLGDLKESYRGKTLTVNQLESPT